MSSEIKLTGNVITSTGQAKYYGSSGYFDGVGAYITVAEHTDWQLGTSDFTIEMWVKTSDSNAVLVDHYTSTQAGSWQLGLNPSGYLLWYTNIGIKTGSVAINNNAWHHIAVTRSSGNLSFWVDGVQDGVPTSHSTNLNYTSASIVLAIGAQVTTRNTTYDFSGYINDLGIWKGAALYGATFTPPTKRICSISGTIKDDTNTGTTRTVIAVTRSNPTRAFSTTSASDGTYSLSVPDIECSVIALDDTVGTLYNDLIARVIPG
jgi:hypothetical protein